MRNPQDSASQKNRKKQDVRRTGSVDRCAVCKELPMIVTNVRNRRLLAIATRGEAQRTLTAAAEIARESQDGVKRVGQASRISFSFAAAMSLTFPSYFFVYS